MFHCQTGERNLGKRIILLRGNDINVSTIFEKRNIKVINSTYTINNCVDKLKTHKICDELNIKQIKTYHFKNISYSEIIKLVGLPFVLKYRFGKQGFLTERRIVARRSFPFGDFASTSVRIGPALCGARYSFRARRRYIPFYMRARDGESRRGVLQTRNVDYYG